MACLAPFFHSLTKQHNFQKHVKKHKMCVDFLYRKKCFMRMETDRKKLTAVFTILQKCLTVTTCTFHKSSQVRVKITPQHAIPDTKVYHQSFLTLSLDRSGHSIISRLGNPPPSNHDKEGRWVPGHRSCTKMYTDHVTY